MWFMGLGWGGRILLGAVLGFLGLVGLAVRVLAWTAGIVVLVTVGGALGHRKRTKGRLWGG